MTGKLPLVIILGPTAVGKTAYAIAAARALNGEIVNADSRQVYRHMDIGTAKPTPEQQALVPHHLIDVVTPDKTLSLAQYQRLAYQTIDAIHSRNRLPLLAGGTGQYITAVVEGWTIPEVPPNPALRGELEQLAEREDVDAVYERLRALDPITADKVDRRNLRRLIRAIEIVTETGQPMDYDQRKQPPPYDVLQLGLTMERQRLYERADQRLEAMLREGFLDEVRSLLDAGYERALPSMSGLGYRELAAFLAGEMSLEDALAATKRANRDFIRRQYTWFRGHDAGIRWFDVAQSSPDALIDTVRDWLESRKH